MESTQPYTNVCPVEDIEMDSSNSNSDSTFYEKDINNSIRLGFIRKVYGILAMQLTITVGLISLAFIPEVKDFIQKHTFLFYTSAVISFVTCIPLTCCKKVARKVPINYILLLVWTFALSYMVATCASLFDPYIVITAAGLTAIVTISLSIYACTTKTDFTFCGGTLFLLGALMLGWSLFAFSFGIYLNAFYCVCGVFVYGIYLIYDTQLIMGSFGNAYSIEDYIIAAMMIYIDIIQIFLYILKFFGSRND
jgi:FtsH-binding integral membrane protein